MTDQATGDVSARADLAGGLCWMALGGAVLTGALLMDRLADQDVSPYAAPGVMPGLLGIFLTVAGGVLALRGWRQRDATAQPAAAPGRLMPVLGLCLLFGVGLVGHGLPFWAASTVFVTLAILVLGGTGLTPRAVLMALAIGLGAGLAVTLVFEKIFLVHLP